MVAMGFSTMANNAYPDFEILEYHFQNAIYQAEAKQDLVLCAKEVNGESFYKQDCMNAIKEAIKVKISQKSILLLLLSFKVGDHANRDDMATLNEEIDQMVQNSSHFKDSVDKTAKQILRNFVSIKQKYFQ